VCNVTNTQGFFFQVCSLFAKFTFWAKFTFALLAKFTFGQVLAYLHTRILTLNGGTRPPRLIWQKMKSDKKNVFWSKLFFLVKTGFWSKPFFFLVECCPPARAVLHAQLSWLPGDSLPPSDLVTCTTPSLQSDAAPQMNLPGK
jgi:hypothetical protein